ncbi:MAG: redoxin domain-containing protein [Bacteroidia bacterium]|jgi:glutaredoxin-dependent peroxiredoxin|nr:redoxin domain-containing protein [Bacteroidia bacterium]MCF8425430.1 redoxin domain-containing protein [Bacteroidia bacterium]MCF8447216.1 redoxin domain-containing protein [Bacteroidia bacterium]
MSLKKGDKAPSFKLIDTDKKEVSLEDFKGKNLIVHFFPAAFTGVCTTQLCTVRDAISMYHNDKCDVVAISVDLPFTLGKFKELQNLNFTLLSDFNKEAITAYGAIYENWILGLKGVAKRSAFVIDAEGTIQYAEVLESAGDLPNFEAINEVLASL